jgi:hypothetical protein
MKKRYLKTIEDIEALRNTSTVIYEERCDLNYLRFIEGVLCQFSSRDNKLLRYNVTLNVDCNKLYIEVEDEPSEDYIGKLGWFYDNTKEPGVLDWLRNIRPNQQLRYVTQRSNLCYRLFQPLTPEEVEKYTGYKVVKEN